MPTTFSSYTASPVHTTSMRADRPYRRRTSSRSGPAAPRPAYRQPTGRADRLRRVRPRRIEQLSLLQSEAAWVGTGRQTLLQQFQPLPRSKRAWTLKSGRLSVLFDRSPEINLTDAKPAVRLLDDSHSVGHDRRKGHNMRYLSLPRRTALSRSVPIPLRTNASSTTPTTGLHRPAQFKADRFLQKKRLVHASAWKRESPAGIALGAPAIITTETGLIASCHRLSHVLSVLPFRSGDSSSGSLRCRPLRLAIAEVPSARIRVSGPSIQARGRFWIQPLGQ